METPPTAAETKRFHDELGGAIHFCTNVLRIPSLTETCAAVATCQPLGVVLSEITAARRAGGGGVDIFMYNIEDRLQDMDPNELTHVCVPHLRRLGFKCNVFFVNKNDESQSEVPFSVTFEPAPPNRACKCPRSNILRSCPS